MTKILKILAIGAITIALTACSTLGPDYSEPTFNLPKNWSNSDSRLSTTPSSQNISTAWWKNFQDDTLVKLIASGLRSNLNLAVARNRIVAAEQLAFAAGVSGRPTINAGLSGAKSKGSSETGLGRTNTLISTEFETSWEIDLFGKQKRNHEAALATVSKERAIEAGIKTKLIADIASNYIGFRKIEKELLLVETQRKSLVSLLEISEHRVSVGLSSTDKSDEIKIRVLQLDAQISELESSKIIFANKIDTLLGKTTGTSLNRLKSTLGTLMAPTSVAAAIPVNALKQRPDVQEALFALQIENAKIGVAEANRFPSLSLTGTIGLEALAVNAIGNSGSDFSSIRASVLGPIFNSGALKSQANAQVATRDAAIESVRQSVLQGLNEVEDVLTKLHETKNQWRAISDSVLKRRLLTELSRQKFEVGLVGMDEALDAEVDLVNLEKSLVQLESDELQHITDLYTAFGGGWAYDIESTGDI
jgi:multidrug efflux system outer membrane protein